jgi:hypothetical protein
VTDVGKLLAQGATHVASTYNSNRVALLCDRNRHCKHPEDNEADYKRSYWSSHFSPLIDAENPVSALCMDSSSLTNNFIDQNSGANVYLIFRGKRYLLAHHAYAHSGTYKGQDVWGQSENVRFLLWPQTSLGGL